MKKQRLLNWKGSKWRTRPGIRADRNSILVVLFGFDLQVWQISFSLWDVFGPRLLKRTFPHSLDNCQWGGSPDACSEIGAGTGLMEPMANFLLCLNFLFKWQAWSPPLGSFALLSKGAVFFKNAVALKIFMSFPYIHISDFIYCTKCWQLATGIFKCLKYTGENINLTGLQTTDRVD